MLKLRMIRGGNMNLILDDANHIIGVGEETGNYHYEGYLPDDFEQHQSDGYYMIADNVITPVPILEDSKLTVEPSSISKQLTNFAMMIAMNNSKGNEE